MPFRLLIDLNIRGIEITQFRISLWMAGPGKLRHFRATYALMYLQDYPREVCKQERQHIIKPFDCHI